MIQFTKETNEVIEIGDLVYREVDHSFDFEPHPMNCISSILINDIQMEIDETGEVKYVWGFCPKGNWLQTDLIPPVSKRSRLKAIIPEIIPGISKCLNSGVRWPIHFDRNNGWVFIGQDVSCQSENQIEFARNCVAVISSTNSLSGLWLRPKMVT